MGLKYIFCFVVLFSFWLQPTNAQVTELGEPLDCGTDEEVVLAMAGGVTRGEQIVTEAGVQRFMQACPNITVEFIGTPDTTDERLAFYRQFFDIQSDLLDIIEIDIIWPGILADDLLDLTPYIPQEEIDQHFPAIIDALTVDTQLVGIPYFTDAGLLYYRADLLEQYGFDVPQTWNQLENYARIIQVGERAAGHDDFWGFVWQGANYEGLTCDALEWQYSSDGTTIIDADGNVRVSGSAWIEKLEQVAGWVGNISPPQVVTFDEEDARPIFQAGDAAFMRNWPYAYSLMNEADSPIAGLFDVAPLPAGDAGLRAATLGGWNLAISAYTQHPEAAAALIRYLSSAPEQKFRATERSFNPTMPHLYDDTDILAVNPFFGELYNVFVNAVPRPAAVTGRKYETVSFLYFESVNAVLRGAIAADIAMDELELSLQQLLKQ